MNNEQKEMLTLAAKAMGLNGQWLPFIVEMNGVKINTGDVLHANDKIWSPYTSGDDMLDMMCQLKIEPMWDDDLVYCHITGGPRGAVATEYFKDNSHLNRLSQKGRRKRARRMK